MTNELFRAAMHPTEEEIQKYYRKLTAEVKAFEVAHGMSSDEMLIRLRKGEIQETHEICKWCITLKMFGRLKEKHPVNQ